MSDPLQLDSCLRVFAISAWWFNWKWSANCVRLCLHDWSANSEQLCICEWAANSGCLSDSVCHLGLVVKVKVIHQLCAILSAWVICYSWTSLWECLPSLFGGLTESDPPIVCAMVFMSDPSFWYSCVSVNDPGQFWTAVWECLPSLFSGLIERDPPIVCGSVCLSDMPILNSCVWSAISWQLSEGALSVWWFN